MAKNSEPHWEEMHKWWERRVHWRYRYQVGNAEAWIEDRGEKGYWRWLLWVDGRSLTEGREEKLYRAKHIAKEKAEEHKDMERYCIFKHGNNVTVENIHTKKRGVVVEIREVGYEDLKFWVQWEGNAEPEVGNHNLLAFVDDGRKLNLRGEHES